MSDGCADGAAEVCEAGKSVAEADVDADGCVLSVNEAIGLEPKEAESAEAAGEAVSDGCEATLVVREAIELVIGELVIVGCRLIVATELASAGENDAELVATSGAAEEVPRFEDWPT